MFWIEQKAITNKDDRIKIIIEPGVNGSDESYIYELVCEYPPEHKGKWYLGSHLDDGEEYWHSGEDEELGKLWVDRNARFTYRVKQSGDHSFITTKESFLLRNRNAIKDEMSWNHNHGSSDLESKQNDTDLEKVSLVKKQIDDVKNKFKNTDFNDYGDYDGYTVTSYTKEQIEQIEFIQVRENKLFKKHSRNLRKQIDGNLSTKGFYCVLLDEWNDNNTPFGIGGNHSKDAFVNSKHGKKGKIDIILIPKSIWINLNLTEWTKLGKSLNARPDQEKKPTEPEDVFLDYIEVYEKDESKWKSEIKIELEVLYNFKDEHLKKTKRLIKNRILNNKAERDRGQTFAKREKGSSRHKELLQKKKDTVKKNKNIGCKILSPESVNFERASLLCKRNGWDGLTMIINPPTPLSEKNWSDREKLFWECYDIYPSIFKFKFILIDNWVSNIIK